MSLAVLICVIVSILIAIFAVVDAVSIALSVVAVFKLHPFSLSAEALIASLCNVVPLGISIFTLLCITFPAGVCRLCTCMNESHKCCECCTRVCTFYVSVLVAASVAIIGTVVAGILQIFSVTNYEEVLSNSEASTFGRAAAALNFTAAAFGAIIIIATIVVCAIDDEREENWSCCSGLGMISFIFVTILTIASLVAALLTIFIGFFVTNYAEEHGNSKSYEQATIATIFSGGAAGCLLLGFCVGGGVICCFEETIRYVLIIWGNLILGTVVAGGLMMKVGQRFSSGEEVLATDVPLNQGSIATMAYLIGGLNFVTLFIALFPFLVGVGLFVVAKINKD